MPTFKARGRKCDFGGQIMGGCSPVQGNGYISYEGKASNIFQNTSPLTCKRLSEQT